MNYNVKLALTFDNSEFYKVGDLVRVTKSNDTVFVGRIINIDYESFTLDCAIDYVSTKTTIICKDVVKIEKIVPETSFKVKTVEYIR